jgi:hypothetical protein
MATYTRAQGTPIIWAHGADFNPAGASSLGTTENYELDLTGLLNAAGRQGAKGDLGATRPGMYAAFLRWETDGSAPADTGVTVDVYWSASISATAANDNAGGCTGADAAWPADSNEDEWAKQLIYVGCLVLTADASTIQIACINSAFQPPTRYGMFCVDNNSGQAAAADAVEMAVYLVPITEAIA